MPHNIPLVSHAVRITKQQTTDYSQIATGLLRKWSECVIIFATGCIPARRLLPAIVVTFINHTVRNTRSVIPRQHCEQ